MTDVASIYEKIRGSNMNAWVGDADPELVGRLAYEILDQHLTLPPGSRVLDFGCGIGRVMLKLLHERPDLAQVSGVDIIPALVDFCEKNIKPDYDYCRLPPSFR